jgi:hypothetical protein
VTTNFNFAEVEEMDRSTLLVLHWEGSDAEPTVYTPVCLIVEVEEQAQKKVDDGEYGTLDEAMAYLDSIAYICTKEDYDEEQAEE